jgi:Ca2+-binding RTX toxin-like protein
MTTFIGTTGNDVFAGSSGSDLFKMGAGGDDSVSGAGGQDLFEFGAAFTDADTVAGGNGIDTLSLKGNYSRFGVLQLQSVQEVEILFLAKGGAHHDFGYSLAPQASVVETGGTFTLKANTLDADDGLSFEGRHFVQSTLKLIGGHGQDALFGGAKGDTLMGGAGADSLTGDQEFSGADSSDIFLYKSLSDSTVDAPDIVHWDPEAGDRINLRHLDANALVDGDQAFHFIGTSAFSDTPGELRYEAVDATEYRITADVDGDGVADFAIRAFQNTEALPGALVASEFVL